MACYRQIINREYMNLYQDEYYPRLQHSYNCMQMASGAYDYELTRKELTICDMQQAQTIIDNIDTTKKANNFLRDQYYYNGDIYYLLTQLVHSVYKNNGTVSVYHNKITCVFKGHVRLNINIWQNKDGNSFEIEFINRCVNKNAFDELKTKILCDVNTDYFSHHSHL